MPSSDDIIAHAAELLRRLSPEARRQAQRRRERRRRQATRIARRIVIAFVLILAAVTAFAFLIGPIGQSGAMLAALAFLLAVLGIAQVSREPDLAAAATPNAAVDIAALPQRTEDWLDRQRMALPAPAQRPLDAISLQLEALGPQLATLDAREPAAFEVRRLLADELPELVRNYQKVPPALRRTARDGAESPDRQLVEGLGLIGEEIARMNERLAAGDLAALATQGRYLELKYRGGEPD
ncbi:MAG: hypothetical protein JOY99_13525 [Sphingomonadaceae bacterium]|nr:hypothetical protein [Sphingomonadaceae bacterium]